MVFSPPSSRADDRHHFSPLEKVKRSQCFGIYPRLDWWMCIKQPDDFKVIHLLLGEEGWDEGGQIPFQPIGYSSISIALAWRPGHVPSAQDGGLQVRNRFTAIRAVVDDQAVAALFQAHLPGNLGGRQ